MSKSRSALLILIVVILSVIPFFVVRDGEFAGADGEAQKVISEINNEYKPWFSSFFKPASGEVESFLFALQAAIGAGVVGYGLGYLRGSRKKDEEKIDVS